MGQERRVGEYNEACVASSEQTGMDSTQDILTRRTIRLAARSRAARVHVGKVTNEMKMWPSACTCIAKR